MSSSRQARGRDAEDRALAFLQSRGLALLRRNYHCRLGELDLVMQDGNVLVFVEVRLRRNRGFGTAAESVDQHKQDKLMQAALHFMAAEPALSGLPVRFDVMALSNLRVDDSCWIKNAFDAEQ